MGLKFEPKKFKFGMRTLKTGLAVFLVFRSFSALGWEGLPGEVCLTAKSLVFEKTLIEVFSLVKSRILQAMIWRSLSYYFTLRICGFIIRIWVTLLLVPILILTIVINVSFNNTSGIVEGVAALLIITLSIPPDITFTYVVLEVFRNFLQVFYNPCQL